MFLDSYVAQQHLNCLYRTPNIIRANINKGCIQNSSSTQMHSKTILWHPTIFYIGHKNQLFASLQSAFFLGKIRPALWIQKIADSEFFTPTFSPGTLKILSTFVHERGYLAWLFSSGDIWFSGNLNG